MSSVGEEAGGDGVGEADCGAMVLGELSGSKRLHEGRLGTSQKVRVLQERGRLQSQGVVALVEELASHKLLRFGRYATASYREVRGCTSQIV